MAPHCARQRNVGGVLYDGDKTSAETQLLGVGSLRCFNINSTVQLTALSGYFQLQTKRLGFF